MARDTLYSAQFPAGEYYVGDLCYVCHPEWDELCDIMFSEDDYLKGELIVQNKRLFIASTAYGDGKYVDNVGRAYGVDSGSLGIIAVSDIAESELPNLIDGNVIEFTENFIVTAQHGRFKFGDILIDTGYDDYWYESRYETDY